jgi:hypothetical protein
MKYHAQCTEFNLGVRKQYLPSNLWYLFTLVHNVISQKNVFKMHISMSYPGVYLYINELASSKHIPKSRGLIIKSAFYISLGLVSDSRSLCPNLNIYFYILLCTVMANSAHSTICCTPLYSSAFLNFIFF